jgi:predicted Zn-dependent peptidase
VCTSLCDLCRKVVAAAGAVDHDELVKLSEDAFSSLSTDPTTAYDLVAKVLLSTGQSRYMAEAEDILEYST